MSEARHLYIKDMTTVLSFPMQGLTPEEQAQAMIDMEAKVAKRVSAIVTQCKNNMSKFKDPDFGPNDEDEYGAKSLYGNPPKRPGAVGSSKYPQPDKIRWDRPLYADSNIEDSDEENDENDEEEESEGDEWEDDEWGDEFGSLTPAVWCQKGQLFIEGSGSGDVVQGALGDCWFLGALSVVATRQELLEKVFWRLDTYKEHGLFVCRFWKDCAWRFVIIDDQIPCFDNKDGSPIFAKSRDPNELWVPLIEKAYAKLHGCYKSLIGGYVHNGVFDLTGFPPKLIVLKKGYQGFHEAITKEQLWNDLIEWKKWGCLMGCSIQPPPGAKKKVEAESGKGLRLMHAYSLLDLKSIHIDDPDSPGNKKEVRLLRVRNPWGYGEWEGEWSDSSDEREQYDEEIKKAFDISIAEKTEINRMDGTFFIDYDNWINYYTHLFLGMDFPDQWRGAMAEGRWDGDTGGNRKMMTWLANPKFKLTIKENNTQSFISLSIPDSRLTHGNEYYKTPLQQMPLSFDIVTENQASLGYDERVTIDGSIGNNNEQSPQPPYNYAACQIFTTLNKGDYYIIPSLYKRKVGGDFYITVYTEKSMLLEGGQVLTLEQEMVEIKGSGQALTRQQLHEQMENVREKLVARATERGIDSKAMKEAFWKGGRTSVTRTDFKRVLMSLGFPLADFPDDDFNILDKNGDGTITVDEYMDFFEGGIEAKSLPIPPPELPEDDLLYHPVDLSGRLTVRVLEAKELLYHNDWFSVSKKKDSTTDDAKSKKRGNLSSMIRFIRTKYPYLGRYTKIDHNLSDDDETNNNNNNNNNKRMGSKLRTTPLLSSENNKHKKFNFLRKSGTDFAFSFQDLNSFNLDNDDAISEKSYFPGDDENNFDSGKILHEDDYMRKLEGRRDIFFKRIKSAPPRTRACVDCGRIGTTQQCTKKGCTSGFCEDCYKRLPENTKLCEVCFGALEQPLPPPKPKRRRKKKINYKLSSMMLMYKKENKKKKIEKKILRQEKHNKKLKKAENKNNLNNNNNDEKNSIKKKSYDNLTLEIDDVNNNKFDEDEEKKTNKIEQIKSYLSSSSSSSSSTSSSSSSSSSSDSSDSDDDVIPPFLRYDPSRGSPSIIYEIINNVITISQCRSKPNLDNFHIQDDRSGVLSANISRFCPPEYNNIEEKKYNIKTPNTNLESNKRKGHHGTPTPRHLRNTIHSAKSTKSNLSTTKSIGIYTPKSTLFDTRKELETYIKEQESKRLIKIFSRLVDITWADLDQSGTNTKSKKTLSAEAKAEEWFRFFDKNNDGIIEFNEFKQSLEELNLHLSKEEYQLLLDRFEILGPKNGEIDWKEFLNFIDFQNITSGSVNNSERHGKNNKKKKNATFPPIEKIVLSLRRKLRLLLGKIHSSYKKEIKTPTNIEERKKIDKSNSLPPGVSTLLIGIEEPSELSLGTLVRKIFSIFHTQNQNYKSVIFLLKDLGIKINDLDFKRITEAFGCDLDYFIDFLISSSSAFELKTYIETLRNRFLKMCDVDPEASTESKDGLTVNLKKLWVQFAAPTAITVHEEAVIARMEELIKTEFPTHSIEDDAGLEKKFLKRAKRNLANIEDSLGDHNTVEKIDINIIKNLDEIASTPIIEAKQPINSEKKNNNINENNNNENDKFNFNENENEDENENKIEKETILKAKLIRQRLAERKLLKGGTYNVIARMIFDRLYYSPWNHGALSLMADTQKEDNNENILNMHSRTITAATLSAFVQIHLVKNVENKLKFLIKQQVEARKGSIAHLVDVYITGDRRKVWIRAVDPFSLAYYWLSLDDDLNDLKIPGDIVANSTVTSASHPFLDKALSYLCSRLRIITHGQKTDLIMSEDDTFIEHLRHLLNKASLPFFVNLSSLCLSFLLDESITEHYGSINKAVFQSIRKHHKLFHFLSNTSSTLQVSISTYDKDHHLLLSWDEFLAHLLGHRDPYASLELLPAIPRKENIADAVQDLKQKIKNELDNKHDIDDALSVISQTPTSLVAFENVEDEYIDWNAKKEDDDMLNDNRSTLSTLDILGVKKPYNRRVTNADKEGGSFPKWGDVFEFEFQPSALVSQQILFTEVCCIPIDEKPKYVVIMVRKHPDTSTFATIYDPKTASSYKCVGLPMHWKEPGSSEDVQTREDELADIINLSRLSLGEPLTPRVKIHVFSKLSHGDILLGTTQISISPVLSNSGQILREWCLLTRKNGRVATGLIHLELEFKNNLDLEYKVRNRQEKQTKKKHKKEHDDKKKQIQNKLEMKDDDDDDDDVIVDNSNKNNNDDLLNKINQLKNQLKDKEKNMENILLNKDRKINEEKTNLETKINQIQGKLKEKDQYIIKREKEINELNEKLIEEKNKLEILLKNNNENQNNKELNNNKNKEEEKKLKDLIKLKENELKIKENEMNTHLNNIQQQLKEKELIVSKKDEEINRLNQIILEERKKLETIKKEEINNNNNNNNNKIKEEEEEEEEGKEEIIDNINDLLNKIKNILNERSKKDPYRVLKRLLLPFADDNGYMEKDIYEEILIDLGILLNNNELELIYNDYENNNNLINLHQFYTDLTGLVPEVDLLRKTTAFEHMISNNNNNNNNTINIKDKKKVSIKEEKNILHSSLPNLSSNNILNNTKNSLNDTNNIDDNIDYDTYELPEGWERKKTPEGRIYYSCHLTKTTSWYHPLDPKSKKKKKKKKDKKSKSRSRSKY